jgi:DNA-binding response OmpR family regulator
VDFVSDSDARAIEVHVANLRRKLGESPAQPRWIETVRGVGYRLTA